VKPRVHCADVIDHFSISQPCSLLLYNNNNNNNPL